MPQSWLSLCASDLGGTRGPSAGRSGPSLLPSPRARPKLRPKLHPKLRPSDSRRGVASPPGSRAPPVRSFFAPEDLEEAGAALVEALALLTQPEHAQRAAVHAWDDHFSRAPSSASQQSGTLEPLGSARDGLREELHASGNELDSDYASDEGAASDESLPAPEVD